MSIQQSRNFVNLSLAFGLLLLALFIRLVNLSYESPQSDERLWVTRSDKIIDQLHANPLQATTHIGHPGVPPALIMAGAQWISQKYNHHKGLSEGDDGYLYRLDVSRYAIAIVSSFAIPALFLGLLPMLGRYSSVIAAILLAADPRHAGYSRMAHLDSILTLFVVLSTFCYIHAIRTKSWPLKIVAGVFWGLAFSTKPTAVALLPALLIFRWLYSLIPLKNVKKKGEIGFLSWGDIGAVAAAHLTFACIYTRLWFHKSDYLIRLSIESPLANRLFRWGRYLRRNDDFFIISLTCLILVGGFLYLLYRKRSSRLAYHGSIFLLSCAAFEAFLHRFPQILENIIRFWTWTFGLSGEKHVSFGNTVIEAPGYLSLLFSATSEFVLIGCLSSLFFLARAVKKHSFSRQHLFIIFSIVLVSLWLIMLSSSAKQAWRYAIPIAPFLCAIAGYGLWKILKQLEDLVDHKSGLPMLVCLILVTHALLWNPHYQIYHNLISGGLSAALKRHEGVTPVGHKTVVDKLLTLMPNDSMDVPITVAGDAKTYEYINLRNKSQTGIHRAEYGYYPPEEALFVVADSSHIDQLPEYPWKPILVRDNIIYTYRFNGVELVHIFKVPQPDYQPEFLFRLSKAHHTIGKKQKIRAKDGSVITTLYAEVGQYQIGHLLFYPIHRFGSGTYRYTIDIALDSIPSNLDPDTKILEMHLEPACDIPVVWKEIASLLDESLHARIRVECRLPQNKRLAPNVVWHPVINVRILGASIERIGPVTPQKTPGSFQTATRTTQQMQ